ncbi:MAG TPA: polyprenol monophosphomannose synthase [Vicinamibacterales bacterium]|nr:polyprenol monophosphomannose synthase [Vicinamibacterales bacterium]
MTALVIIPTYNERDNIAAIVEQLLKHRDVRVMVVDDNSPDGTGAIADELAAAHAGRVSVMHRTANRGFGRAYIDGIRAAIQEPVDVICQMDSDFSHDPARLPALIAATSNADIVIGSRYVAGGGVENWPVRRRWLSRFANAYVRTLTGMQAHDCTSGFRCWRRDALAALPLDEFVSDGYSFLVEMLFVAAKQGRRIAEVPITYSERRDGQSKMSHGVILESAITPWRLVGSKGRVH